MKRLVKVEVGEPVPDNYKFVGIVDDQERIGTREEIVSTWGVFPFTVERYRNVGVYKTVRRALYEVEEPK